MLIDSYSGRIPTMRQAPCSQLPPPRENCRVQRGQGQRPAAGADVRAEPGEEGAVLLLTLEFRGVRGVLSDEEKMQPRLDRLLTTWILLDCSS